MPPALHRSRHAPRPPRPSAWRAAAVLAVAALALAGCDGGDGDGGVEVGEPAASLEVTSERFGDGGEVPAPHTCDGADVAPPLAWEGVPDGAAEVAVVVDDPDAPDGTFTHWLVAGLPGEDGSLDAGSDAGGDSERVEGENDFGERGWAGPCPPEGDGAHTYRFRALALDAPTGLEPGFDAAALEAAVEGAVLAEGVLEAVYER